MLGRESVMAILDDYEEPENNNDFAEYLARYYGAASAMSNIEEIYPYEVLVFSEQPGVLRTDK